MLKTVFLLHSLKVTKGIRNFLLSIETTKLDIKKTRRKLSRDGKRGDGQIPEPLDL